MRPALFAAAALLLAAGFAAAQENGEADAQSSDGGGQISVQNQENGNEAGLSRDNGERRNEGARRVPIQGGSGETNAGSGGGSGPGTDAVPPGVVMVSLPPPGATGAASRFTAEKGVTYAAPLFDCPNGDLIGISPEGGGMMGTNAHWEVALSAKPGDWATAKAATKQITLFGKKMTVHPYYQAQGGESGGVNWVYQDDSQGTPVVAHKPAWYFDFRADMSGDITIQPSICH
jgi:hypothetical protein